MMNQFTTIENFIAEVSDPLKALCYPMEYCYSVPEIHEYLKWRFDLPEKKDLEKMCEKYEIGLDELYFTNPMVLCFVYMSQEHGFAIEFHELSTEKEDFGLISMKDMLEQARKWMKKDKKKIVLSFTSNVYGTLVHEMRKEKLASENFVEEFKLDYTSKEYGFNIKKSHIKKLRNSDTEREFVSDNLEDIADDDGLLTIYRGEGSMSTDYKKAWSWSTSLEQAQFFANRFTGASKLYKAKVSVDDVFAYIEERGEDEVLLESKDLIDVELIA